jgi:multidrug efflux pump subunit AcrB
LPSGYYIDYAGAYKDQQQSFKELLLILMASCLLVLCFIISISKFKSGFHPVYFRFGYLKLFIIVFTNTPLNVGSYTGLIMIVGILVKMPFYLFTV